MAHGWTGRRPQGPVGRAGRVALSARLVLGLAALLVLGSASGAAAATPAKHRHRTPHKPPGPPVAVILTDHNLSLALSRRPNLHFSSTAPSGLPIIHVRDGLRFQPVLGIGAALTDTSAWLLQDELPAARRQAVMASLFGPSGIGLDFLRVPIAASDFTALRAPYSYDDLPAGQTDPSLQSFSIAHDLAYTIPVLRQVLALDPRAFLLASPWSSPGWMKQNDDLSNIYGQGWLLPQYVGTFADYLVRYLRAYRSLGINFQAITPQNEPGNKTSYPGMTLTESTEETLIDQYLAPDLRAAGLSTGIYGYDSSWNPRSMPFAMQLAGGAAAHALAGLATHCYQGSPLELSALHNRAPTLDEMVSECSPGIKPLSTTELLISATRNWATRVALWNLALDPAGGPVQPPNPSCHGCSGIVTVNEFTGTASYTLDYFQLGQLSRYLQPGAVRIASEHFVGYHPWAPGVGVVTPGLDDAAYLNPDGSKVLLAYNNATAPVAFAVQSHRRFFTFRMLPRQTATFIWDQPTRGR